MQLAASWTGCGRRHDNVCQRDFYYGGYDRKWIICHHGSAAKMDICDKCNIVYDARNDYRNDPDTAIKEEEDV